MLQKISNLKEKINQNFQKSHFWAQIPEAKLLSEINLHNWGGCRLYVDDINNDGKKELIWLQSAGIFKSKIYKYPENNPANQYMNSIGQKEIFCVTVTNTTGEMLWQTGTPYLGKSNYLSHASENILSTGDINEDGRKEILVIDSSSSFLILNPLNGSIINKIELPSDNFSNISYKKISNNPADYLILVGVTDRAYPPHSYGNPWLMFDRNHKLINQQDYLGAGHSFVIEDVNSDGINEAMIGYQLANLNGKVIWTLDSWQNREINSINQHVDHIQPFWDKREWFAAISGSDKQYFINSKGEELWSKMLPHPQFCLIGKYNGETRIYVFNQRELMISFSLVGTEMWRGITPEYWPFGKPQSVKGNRPIHMNDPADLIENIADNKNDFILYKEGGWPYLIDFDGKVIKKFPLSKNAKLKNIENSFHRINDIGQSFNAILTDINNDGAKEVLIYNRNFLWTYSI